MLGLKCVMVNGIGAACVRVLGIRVLGAIHKSGMTSKCLGVGS